MSRISATFSRLRTHGQCALIPYIMAGDPHLSETPRIVMALEKGGADLIEIGVPFTDPVADGPVIQRAAERALAQGVTLRRVLESVAAIRRTTAIPLILMTYCNPVWALGLDSFFEAAAAAGLDGLIIPDLTPEEASPYLVLARRHRIEMIFFIAPTTPISRARKIAQMASGFIYYVSLTGTTGAPLTDRQAVLARMNEIKSLTDLPLAVGFGISTPEEARDMATVADGVIVGSALVKIIAEADPLYLSKLQEAVVAFKGRL